MNAGHGGIKRTAVPEIIEGKRGRDKDLVEG